MYNYLLLQNYQSVWWFQTFFMFAPTWGRFPFWLIFFRWGWNHQLGNVCVPRWAFQKNLGERCSFFGKTAGTTSYALCDFGILKHTMYLFGHRNNPTETFEGQAAAAKIALAAGARGARLGAVVVWRGDPLMRRLGEGLYTHYQDCLVKVGWPSPRSLAYSYNVAHIATM